MWHNFWSTVGAVSVRVKIMGIVALGILVTALAIVLFVRGDDAVSLERQLQERGIAIGTGLAAQSRDLILTNNLFALYSLIRDIRSADSEIVYVFVVDNTGNLLVHTFDEGFPADLLGKNNVNPPEPYRVQRLKAERYTIQDIGIAVLGGKAGEIHLGMSESNINEIVSSHIQHILLWVALVLIWGLVGAYGFASILTSPISQMARATQAVGRGDYTKWRSPDWASRDEIGALGNAFNSMSEELKHKEEMRVHLLAKIIGAQEEERKRVARELHDETSQSLTSLMVGLKLIEDSSSEPEVSQKIADLRALTAQTMDEVRHMATELRPSLLDDLGLEAAIKRYTGEYAAKMNINVDTQVSLDGKDISPDKQTTVFRIVQEALTNIAKYADAKNVSVILSCRDSSLVAVVEDDGKGFDVSRVMASPSEANLGLFGMYERASLSGGKLTVESTPGSGTTIFLEVPLAVRKAIADG